MSRKPDADHLRRALPVAAVLTAFCLAAVPVSAAPIEGRGGGISWVHGGVGEEDRIAMEQVAAQHNLHLTFAFKGSGAYLADVQVAIRSASGQTLAETTASGPWLYARLPDGDYRIAATHGSQTLDQRIAIKGGARREWVFRFDSPPEQP
jgi:hypothetical protein